MLVLECRNAPCCHRGHNYTGGGHTGLPRLAAGTGGFVLLRAHIGAGEGWWGGAIVGRGSVMWQVSGGHSSLLGTLFVGHISARQSRCLATTPPARGLINTGILMGAFKILSKLVQQRQWLIADQKITCSMSIQV